MVNEKNYQTQAVQHNVQLLPIRSKVCGRSVYPPKNYHVVNATIVRMAIAEKRGQAQVWAVDDSN